MIPAPARPTPSGVGRTAISLRHLYTAGRPAQGSLITVSSASLKWGLSPVPHTVPRHSPCNASTTRLPGDGAVRVVPHGRVRHRARLLSIVTTRPLAAPRVQPRGFAKMPRATTHVTPPARLVLLLNGGSSARWDPFRAGHGLAELSRPGRVARCPDTVEQFLRRTWSWLARRRREHY